MKAALLALVLAAGATIEVYDNGHRVGVANPVINCKPPARCFIEGNAVRIGADAGAASSSLPTPPVCGDGGTALGWDGGAFACVTTTASNTWVTALDCDFTNAGSQSFTLDGGLIDGGYLNPYTICGAPFYMQELINQLATRTLDSNGLNVTPTTGGDNTPADHGAPRTITYLSQVVPNFTADTPIRATVYVTGNFAADYDFACLGLLVIHTPTVSYNTGLLSNPEVCRIHYGANTYLSWSIYQGGSYPATPPGGSWITPNVLRFTYPSGVGSAIQVDSIGTYSSGFPADTAFLQTYVSQPPLNVAGSLFGSTDGTKAYAVEMVAARATSGTALVIHFKRLKVEYKP